MLQIAVNGGAPYTVEKTNDGCYINGKEAIIDIAPLPAGRISVLINGKSYTAIVERIDKKSKEVVLSVNGTTYTTAIAEPIDTLLNQMGLNTKAGKKADPVKAPMPGMIHKILVSVGQQVNKGDGLIILEAMKMENILKATAAGTIKAIAVAEKTAVEKGTILVELE